MTAFRLYLGDRLLGERRGRDVHLVRDLSATENLLNTKDFSIKDNGIALFLRKSCPEEDRNNLIDIPDVKHITGDLSLVIMLESALAKDRAPDKVGLDKVVCVDSGITPATTVTCSTSVLMGSATTGS